MSAWIPVEEQMPDDETVLIALSNGEVWTGFHDGDHGWSYVTADPVMEYDVTHWMRFPEPPGR